MPVQTSKLRAIFRYILSLFALACFVSCATEKAPAPLVSNPDEQAESALPWNKQEKWEVAPQLSGLSERGR
jgi:hypothetical protein